MANAKEINVSSVTAAVLLELGGSLILKRQKKASRLLLADNIVPHLTTTLNNYIKHCENLKLASQQWQAAKDTEVTSQLKRDMREIIFHDMSVHTSTYTYILLL